MTPSRETMKLSEHTSRCQLSGSAAKRNLLILAYYYPPMNESGALRPFRFAKYLSALGVATHVVTSGEGGQCAVLQDSIAIGKEFEPNGSAVLFASAVQRLLPYNDQLNWTPHAIAAAEIVLTRGNVKAMFSTSPPIATHIAAFLLKRRYGLRWIADLRDPIYGNPFRPGRAAGWWDRFVERCVMKHADRVIGNTEAAVEVLKSRYSQFSNKIQLIWNGYDPEEELAAFPLASKRPKILTHAGSLYSGRHPGTLLMSLSRLIKRGLVNPEDIRVRLIGYLNSEEPWAVQTNFQNFLSEPWLELTNRIVPRCEAQKAMAKSHYLLLIDTNERGVQLQLPAKLFEYIRIGRPILAFTTPGSPTEYILKRCGVQYACIYEHFSDDESDSCLLSFLQLPTNPISPSNWFRQKFDGEVQTKNLASIIGSF